MKYLFLLASLSFSQLPVAYQLFGPVQHDGREVNTYGSTYVFIGDALTASTKVFPFQSMPLVEKATWKHVWTPNNTAAYVRLIHADNGPSNITQIVAVQSNGSSTPTVETVDITNDFNSLVVAGVEKQIGFQVKDDGVNESSIYESRIELVPRRHAITVPFQLYGPTQRTGSDEAYYGTTYVFIGNCLTPSTKFFRFSAGMPKVERATWTISWIPRTTAAHARLVHFDDGVVNITEMVEIASTGLTTPTREQKDFTAEINALIDAKVDKQIGFQVKDDGSTMSIIYESRLEITFKL